MTVTSTPKSTSIEAHSMPITPPPIIVIEDGSAFINRAPSDVITDFSSTSSPGNDLGFDPVAITRFFRINISFSLPLSISTEIVPGIGENMEAPSILPVP